MSEVIANAADAAKAVKTPLWMSFQSMTDLNAYIKRSKMSTAKGDEIRAKWSAHANDGAPSADEAILILSGDARTIPLKDGKAVVEEVQPTKDAEHTDAPESPSVNGNTDHDVDMPTPRKKKAAASPGLIAAIGERMAIINKPHGMVTQYIDPTLIDVRDNWNARFDFGDIEELGRQIKSQKAFDGIGVLHDLRVKAKDDGSGRFWLVDGERRWNAVMGLIDGGEVFEYGIPAKVEPASASDDDLIIKMFLANEGKHLLPYEEGMYFKRLQDGGMTIKQIEEKTGRSDSSIWYGLALVEADDDLVDAVKKGTIGTTIAKTIAVNARGNKQRQKELVAKAKDAKKDPKKTAALKKEIDADRRAKAAKERPNLKIKARKADEADIAAMGEKVGARLKEVLEMMGMDFDTNFEEWISDDRELQIAANFGALQALKAVMGVKVKVTF